MPVLGNNVYVYHLIGDNGPLIEVFVLLSVVKGLNTTRLPGHSCLVNWGH